MNLPKEDVELFFKLHPALLQYANQRLGLFPNIKTGEELRNIGLDTVVKVRDALWKNKDFIDEFVSENPVGFSKEECAEIASWKGAISGNFYIFRHLKKYTIFLTEKEPTKVYGVCSLNTPLDEMFWNLPVYAKAVLLPFRGRIIYDGVLYPHSITFGHGFRFDLNAVYREIKERFGIIETLN